MAGSDLVNTLANIVLILAILFPLAVCLAGSWWQSLSAIARHGVIVASSSTMGILMIVVHNQHSVQGSNDLWISIMMIAGCFLVTIFSVTGLLSHLDL